MTNFIPFLPIMKVDWGTSTPVDTRSHREVNFCRDRKYKRKISKLARKARRRNR